MLRRLPAALCAAVLALGAAACGEGDDEPPAPDVPADEMLDRAFERLPRSGVAAVDLEAVLPGAPAEPVAAQLEGPFVTQSELPDFDLEGEAQAAGFGIDLRLVAVGGDAYVVFFGENYRVGRGGVADLERRAAGVKPLTWFGTARHAGSEEVDGTDVYRVEAPLNADQVAFDLQEAGLGVGADVSGLEGGTAVALIGVDDGVIRGIRVTAESLSLDVSLSDLGEEQEIEPPPGGGFQPIEDLLERVPGL